MLADVPVRFMPSVFSNEALNLLSPAGSSLSDIVAQAGIRDIPGTNVCVWVDDREIPRGAWPVRFVCEGELVSIRSIPTSSGGGGGGKSPMRTVMTIGVIAAAAWTGGLSLGAFSVFGATFSVAQTLAGVVALVGMMAVNLICPPSTPSLSSSKGYTSKSTETSNTYSINGARNTYNKYGALPKVYGEHRVWPFYGGEPYTEIVGEDEYLVLLFDVGHGRLDLSEHKIGETAIEEFTDVEMVVHEGVYSDGNPLEIYKNDVHQAVLSVDLEYGDDYTVRTTEMGTDKISFDIGFGRLFEVTNGGDYISASVSMEAGLMLLDDEGEEAWDEWRSAFGEDATTDVDSIHWIQGSPIYQTDTETGTRYISGYTVSNCVRYYLDSSASLSTVLSGGRVTIEGASNSVHNGTFQVVTLVQGDSPYVDVTNTAVSSAVYDEATTAAQAVVSSSSSITITDNCRSEVRRGYARTLPQTGQYKVRWKRTSQNTDTEHIFDDMQVTALRSIKDSGPSNWKIPVCQVELRIKANGQLSGVIDEYNCVAKAYIPVYDEVTETWEVQLTRNPSWAFCDILMSAASRRPVAQTRIHLPTMVTFAQRCEDKGWFFDHVFDYKTTVFEALNIAARCGRASRGIYDYKHAVVMDIPQTVPCGMITPRNSFEYSGSKTFASVKIHALRVRFINKEIGYSEDERIVYADGYDVSTAQNFEILDLIGVTEPDNAWRDGRYFLATTLLRPEVHSLSQDIEWLLLNRGDMFVFQHDVPMFGVGTSARVKSIDATDESGYVTQLTVDDGFPLEAGVQYTLQIRRSSGVSETTRFTPSVTARFTQFTLTGGFKFTPNIDRGDLFSVAQSTIGQAEMIVVGIQPAYGGNAEITFQAHAPEVHAADYEEIPEWNSQITRPVRVEKQVPPKPSITTVVSDESAIVRLPSGMLQPRILVSFVPGTSVGTITSPTYQAEFKLSDGQTWTRLALLGSDIRQFAVSPVQEGVLYDIRLRSVSQYGVASEWTYKNNHTVVGQSTNPPSVDSLMLEGKDLVWTYSNEPIDFSLFRIKVNQGENRSWDSALEIGDSPTRARRVDISKFYGTHTFLVKAEDYSKNESDDAAVLIAYAGDMELTNVLNRYEQAPDFSGTLDSCTVVDGELVADATSLMWSPAGELMWAGSSLPMWDEVYASMSYTWEFVPDSTEVGETIVIEHDATGGTNTRLFYKTFEYDLMWQNDEDPMWEDGTDPMWPMTEWLLWPGSLSGIQEQMYMFMLEISGGDAQGTVSQLDVVVDVPDINIPYEDAVISATTGSRLAPTQALRAIKTVVVTLQDDGGDATTVRVFDKDSDLGPLVKCFDDSNNVVQGTVDALVQGY